jgi:hypothetical protein
VLALYIRIFTPCSDFHSPQLQKALAENVSILKTKKRIETSCEWGMAV